MKGSQEGGARPGYDTTFGKTFPILGGRLPEGTRGGAYDRCSQPRKQWGGREGGERNFGKTITKTKKGEGRTGEKLGEGALGKKTWAGWLHRENRLRIKGGLKKSGES